MAVLGYKIKLLNVGIGTTSPLDKLHLFTGAAEDIALSINNGNRRWQLISKATTGNFELRNVNNAATAITVLGDGSGNVTIQGTLTVNGNQSGAADHVFDDYDDIELLRKWRKGESLPFETGDILNRDRLLRDAVVQLAKRVHELEELVIQLTPQKR